MVNWKLPAGLFIVWFLFTICANIIEIADPITSADSSSFFSVLFLHEAQTTADTSFLKNLQNVPVVAGRLLVALWDAIRFDYNWMKVDFLGKLFRYICLGVSFGFFLTFIMYLFVRK